MRIWIHPDNPQQRLIDQVVAAIDGGGVVALPTDSCYALVCHLGDKQALDRIRHIRDLDNKHNFTLLCRDLSEIASYARIDNIAFRLIKTLTPGPYTFILPATKEVPKRLLHPKKKTIGIRIPQHQVTHRVLEGFSEPLMSVTLIMPGETLPFNDGDEIEDALANQLDMIVDAGSCDIVPTTVIDLSEGEAVVLRQGKGEAAFLATVNS